MSENYRLPPHIWYKGKAIWPAYNSTAMNPETQLIESAISVAIALRRLGATVPTGDQQSIQAALSDLAHAHSALLMADDAYHRSADDLSRIVGRAEDLSRNLD